MARTRTCSTLCSQRHDAPNTAHFRRPTTRRSASVRSLTRVAWVIASTCCWAPERATHGTRVRAACDVRCSGRCREAGRTQDLACRGSRRSPCARRHRRSPCVKHTCAHRRCVETRRHRGPRFERRTSRTGPGRRYGTGVYRVRVLDGDRPCARLKRSHRPKAEDLIGAWSGRIHRHLDAISASHSFRDLDVKAVQPEQRQALGNRAVDLDMTTQRFFAERDPHAVARRFERMRQAERSVGRKGLDDACRLGRGQRACDWRGGRARNQGETCEKPHAPRIAAIHTLGSTRFCRRSTERQPACSTERVSHDSRARLRQR
jgi:hypothetical protein